MARRKIAKLRAQQRARRRMDLTTRRASGAGGSSRADGLSDARASVASTRLPADGAAATPPAAHPTS